MQRDYEKEILAILANQKAPLTSREIIARIKERMVAKFSEADLERVSHDRVRWEATARFAIYQGLKKRKLIEAKSKNQWLITSKGLEQLKLA